MSIISDFCIWDNRTFFEGESDKDVQNSKKRTILCLIQKSDIIEMGIINRFNSFIFWEV